MIAPGPMRVDAVHVAPCAGHALGVGQAAFAVGEVAQGPVRKRPGMMTASPGHDLGIHRQAEPLGQAIGGLAMHPLEVQGAEDHVGLRREDPERDNR